jgi:hypothetical protein
LTLSLVLKHPSKPGLNGAMIPMLKTTEPHTATSWKPWRGTNLQRRLQRTNLEGYLYEYQTSLQVHANICQPAHAEARCHGRQFGNETPPPQVAVGDERAAAARQGKNNLIWRPISGLRAKGAGKSAYGSSSASLLGRAPGHGVFSPFADNSVEESSAREPDDEDVRDDSHHRQVSGRRCRYCVRPRSRSCPWPAEDREHRGSTEDPKLRRYFSMPSWRRLQMPDVPPGRTGAQGHHGFGGTQETQ